MAFSERERQEALRLVLARLDGLGLGPGDKMPGEQRLCDQLDLSRHLVREVLEDLETDGVVQRRGRSGTYLLRSPDDGPVPARDRSTAPLGMDNKTVSLMLGFPVAESDLRDIQAAALRRGYLVQIYFSGEHGHQPAEERAYLEQAVANRYTGALIHPTPLSPGNETLFRRISARMRLAHIGYHDLRLPAQSFFLPDLRFAGAASAACLLSAGCSRITCVTGLPPEHHYPAWIARGLAPVAEAHRCAWQVQSFREPGLLEVLTEAAADDRQGLVLTSWNEPLDAEQSVRALLADLGAKRRCIVVAERTSDRLPAGVPAWVFDWRAAALQALQWITADSPALCRQLYLPVFHPSGAARGGKAQQGLRRGARAQGPNRPRPSQPPGTG